MSVIVPLSLEELRNFFDDKAIEILEFQLKKSVIAQPEIENGTLKVTQDYIEKWCAMALENVKAIGGGSYPIDIIKENEWGADIKALSYKVDSNGNLSNGESGEASLAQKFTDTGENLDELFIRKEFDKILDGWIDIVNRKNGKVLSDKSIKEIYYFFFLVGKTKFYLCGSKLNLQALRDVEVNREQSTDNSVYLRNYIDDRYGTTKIYKAKKRLELRLRAKNWVDDGLCITLKIPQKLPTVDLRKIDLKEYLDNLLKNV